MPRTAEQKAADDNLRAAIDRVVEAYGLLGDPGETPLILSEYLVITCHQGFEGDGQGNARYNWTVQDDGGPWHHVLGLLEQGARVIEAAMEENFRED